MEYPEVRDENGNVVMNSVWYDYPNHISHEHVTAALATHKRLHAVLAELKRVAPAMYELLSRG